MLTSQRHRQALGLGAAHQLDAGGAAQPAQVHARAGVAHQLEDRRAARSSRPAPARRSGPGAWRAAPWRRRRCRARRRSAAARRCSRRSPRTAARGAAPACRAAPRRPGAKPMQPASVSSAISVSASPARPRVSAPSGKTRARSRLRGAELEHLDQARLVEHRVGVGRADQAGDAAGDRRGQLRLEHAFVLVARLAQARARSTRPGATTAPPASSVRSGVKSAGGRAPTATMRPAARASRPRSSRPVAGRPAGRWRSGAARSWRLRRCCRR